MELVDTDQEAVLLGADQSEVVLEVVDQSYDELVEVDQSEVVLVVVDQSDTVPFDDVPFDAANSLPSASAFSRKSSNVLSAVGFIANTMPLPQWLFSVPASC